MVVAPGRYALAPIFGIRPTGVPFDVLERLGTPAAADAARALLAADAELAAATDELLARLPVLVADRATQARVWKAVKRGADVADLVDASVDRYHHARRQRTASAHALDEVITREYRRIHGELVRAGAVELPEFLLLESGADATARLTAPAEPATTHNSKDRQNDRTLALYLQRVCAKNDTIGRFGPMAWGTITAGAGIHIHARPGVAARRIEIERWVIKGLIAHMNGEPDVRAEVAPRLHPHGRLDATTFVREDEDRAIPLSDADHALAARCDGRTPAHALGELATLEALADRGVIRWEVEPIAIDASPLATLRADVASWRDGAPRARWTPRLDAIADIARRFGEDTSTAARGALIGELRALLGEIDVAQPHNQRTLYAARNPINENCYQAADITVGARSVDAMLRDAAPWFALFADTIAWAGARVYHRLRDVIAAAPRRNGVLSYATLVRVARAQGLDVDTEGLHRQIGAETFADVKRELAAQLAARADARCWQLTADDLGFLHRHAFPRGGELSYASADLQVGATSREDAAAGRIDWIVAELHFGPALLQHCMYWACPDKPRLHDGMAATVEHRPFCVRDAYTQAPVHVCGAVMEAMPSPTYVGGGRTPPSWRAIRPADAEVVIDEERCDIRLRAPGTHADLGSIVRTVRLVTGIHPFFPLERSPHEPRLKLGDVVVQREAWHVESAAIGEPRPTGVSAMFVAGIERARAERGIPRWVFVRPAPHVLAANAWFARDKDHKPLCVDLESVVFLDILERRLRKYGTLLFTEMLPAPAQLVWETPDGRFPFELRTTLVPGASR